MRTFDINRRIHLNRENELWMFGDELEYYRKHNRYPVKLFGKDIVNIYKNINIQIVITRACPYRCGFCIENDNADFNRREHDFYQTVDNTFEQYKSQGITPHVSITGGEPTLHLDRIQAVLELCKKHGITRININTNGMFPDLLKQLDCSINLSRHHYIDYINNHIFERECLDVIVPDRTNMQCVMMDGYIDDIDSMKRYMEHYGAMGAVGFSFRGLSELDAGKQYQKEIAFSKEHSIDIFDVANSLADDPEFEFIQQKIGDHYLFEIWKWRGLPVRITYSNFKWLREVEKAERERGDWNSRATIIHANGHVYSGWTYDLNLIH